MATFGSTNPSLGAICPQRAGGHESQHLFCADPRSLRRAASLRRMVCRHLKLRKRAPFRDEAGPRGSEAALPVSPQSPRKDWRHLLTVQVEPCWSERGGVLGHLPQPALATRILDQLRRESPDPSEGLLVHGEGVRSHP